MFYIPRLLTFTDTAGEIQTAKEADLLAGNGPVVVLGEPGMGKSELLRTLARGADHADYVTARALMRRPNDGGPSNRILIIDALDELAAAEEHDPVQNVLTKLAALGSPPFILSCRAADWRSVAKQDILEDYGTEPREYRLSPLTEAEATAFLAASHGDDRADDLIKELKERGLSEFYGNPLTLQLINRIADDPGGLPASRAALFLRASELLRSEHNKKRTHAPLAALGSEEALNAAGAACAALILTGSEAIAVGAQGSIADGDLHVSEVAALPGAAAMKTVLGSNLFLRRDGGDRFGPFHRALAEFLGARWLASRLPGTSMRRLLGLLIIDGGVPASLRGLHAWLAHFSPEIAPAVMATDPYGVLRYGDAVDLSPTAARALINGLEGLAAHDPWFRSEDWGRHAAPGLTQAALASDLRDLLLAPETNFQLKSLLLAALPKSEAAHLLDADLAGIFMGERSNPYSFHERSAAFDALAELRSAEDWTPAFEELLVRPGEDDRRLVVEGLYSVGAHHFAPSLIARAALAYLGLLPGGTDAQAHVDTFGPLHLLTGRLTAKQASDVLNAMVEVGPNTEGLGWECRYALSDLIDTLLASAVKGSPDPIQLARWLELLRERDHHESEQRKEVRAYLAGNDRIRWAIQHHQLIEKKALDDDINERIYSVGALHSSLRFTDSDFAHILAAEVFKVRPRTEPVKLLWQGLVRYAATQRGLSSAVKAAAAPFTADEPALEAFLQDVDRVRIPHWRREQAAQRAYHRYKKRRQNERVRQHFREHEAALRAGDHGWLNRPALAYLNRFTDLDRKAAPGDRLTLWLGDNLSDAVLTGLEGLLSRGDLPTVDEVAESYAAGRRWYVIAPLLAAACERVNTGRGLDDLPSTTVLLLALGEAHEHLQEDVGGKKLAAALQLWFSTRAAERERYLRIAIEPQLAQKPDHITGLYSILHADDPHGLLPGLAVEWLRRFPSMSASGEEELINFLVRRGLSTDLRALVQERVADDEALDGARRDRWLSVAFFADFEAAEPALDAAVQADPDLFWQIRERGWPKTGPQPSVRSLAWLVRKFRGPFPMTPHPSGSSSGDRNAWDATGTIHGMIRRLASDTSDAALAALSALRDGCADDYQPFIQNACAQQLKARRESAFLAPDLKTVKAVLDNKGPVTVADLQAITLDALTRIQERMGRDDVNQVGMFHGPTGPLGEEACRDRLVILLRDIVGHGIDAIPERFMPEGKRADVVMALGSLQLPIEIKGQWHRELWSAASTQLDAFYTIEWRAKGIGLYLVFWFGNDVPDSRKLKSRGRGTTRCGTPDQLQKALTEEIPEHRRDAIKVVVMDVSKGSRPPIHS